MVLVQIGGATIDGRSYNQRISKPVVQMLNGEIVAFYESIYKAQTETEIRHIYECVNGKRKTAGGYEWRLAQGDEIWKIN